MIQLQSQKADFRGHAIPQVRSQLGGTKPLPRPEMQTWGVKDALQPTLASSVGLNVRRTSVVGRCSAARIVVLEMMDEPCKSTARQSTPASIDYRLADAFGVCRRNSYRAGKRSDLCVSSGNWYF